jgi:hypothetical protein
MKLKGEYASRRVWLDGVELKPYKSQRIINHSPDGFNWGYGGSGPAQLALAILLEVSKEDALNRYQSFKGKVIARLPQADFEIEINPHDIFSGR